MNDSSNVDPAHSAPGHRDENDALVEAARVIADLNQRRVCMVRVVTAGGVISRVAHPQPAPSSTGRPGNRKDRDPALLKKDVEVAVVEDVRINADGRTEALANGGGVVVDGYSGNTKVGEHQGFGALGGRGKRHQRDQERGEDRYESRSVCHGRPESLQSV